MSHVISARYVARECSRLRHDHLNLHVGDKSRRSEEIVKNLDLRLSVRSLLVLFNAIIIIIWLYGVAVFPTVYCESRNLINFCYSFISCVMFSFRLLSFFFFYPFLLDGSISSSSSSAFPN